MDKTLAYVFVVLLGSEILEFYSLDFPWFALFLIAVLLVTIYGSIAPLRRDPEVLRAMRGLLSPDIIVWTLALLVPVFLMVLSDRSFPKGVWTTSLFLILEFLLAAHLGLRKQLRGSLALGSLTVMLMGVATNVIELFVQGNIWSIAPGRAAGFYVNPNTSASCLVGYGIVYYAFRPRELRHADLPVLGFLCAGVFATFSRTGYVMLFLPAVMCYLVRADFTITWKSVFRFAIVLAATVLFLVIFVDVVIPHIDLNREASRRLETVLGLTFSQEYSKERAGLAEEAWNLFLQSPVTGAGVGTAASMKLGPHNMFAAVALDYGVMGLLIYVLMILRLVWAGFSGLEDRQIASLIIAIAVWLATLSFASHHVLGDSPIIFLLAISASVSSRRRSSPVHGSKGGLNPVEEAMVRKSASSLGKRKF